MCAQPNVLQTVAKPSRRTRALARPQPFTRRHGEGATAHTSHQQSRTAGLSEKVRQSQKRDRSFANCQRRLAHGNGFSGRCPVKSSATALPHSSSSSQTLPTFMLRQLHLSLINFYSQPKIEHQTTSLLLSLHHLLQFRLVVQTTQTGTYSFNLFLFEFLHCSVILQHSLQQTQNFISWCVPFVHLP